MCECSLCFEQLCDSGTYLNRSTFTLLPPCSSHNKFGQWTEFLLHIHYCYNQRTVTDRQHSVAVFEHGNDFWMMLYFGHEHCSRSKLQICLFIRIKTPSDKDWWRLRRLDYHVQASIVACLTFMYFPVIGAHLTKIWDGWSYDNITHLILFWAPFFSSVFCPWKCLIWFLSKLRTTFVPMMEEKSSWKQSVNKCIEIDCWNLCAIWL